MITYVGLMSFTEERVQTVKVTAKRAAAAKEEGRFQRSRVDERRRVRRHADRAEVTS